MKEYKNDCSDLLHIKELFKILRDKREYISFRVLSGKYQGSILQTKCFSVDYLTVSAYVLSLNKTLSFKFYEIEFIDNPTLSFNLSINNDNQTSSSNSKFIDKLGNRIGKGDFIVFSSDIFKKTNNLQFAEIIDITSNKRIIIKTIPENAGEKSFTMSLKYRRNYLKLNEEQINNLVFNRLKG